MKKLNKAVLDNRIGLSEASFAGIARYVSYIGFYKKTKGIFSPLKKREAFAGKGQWYKILLLVPSSIHFVYD